MTLEEWAKRLVWTRHEEGDWVHAMWSDLDDKARQCLPLSAGVPTNPSVFRTFLEHIKDHLRGPPIPDATFAVLSRDDQILLHVAKPSSSDPHTIDIDVYTIVGNKVTFQRKKTKSTRERVAWHTGE
jgi:hypothetical protein